MERLVTILRAAHCRSTHHFFAVDALNLIETRRGRVLAQLLLRHHARYLAGAKDPDTRFRDFRNHVLHVADGCWGGATKSCEKWYRKLIECLDEGRWSESAYAAGVLSHYFTDPLMPLHTAQSKRESVVHRPLEWSVTKSYDRILEQWRQGQYQVTFELAETDGWLSQAVTRSAEVAHRYYDELVHQYDLKAGAKRPTEGFDQHSIDILAGLFGIVLTGWARVLERAAEETASEIPRESLSVATLVAGIQMPVSWIVRRIASVSEQRAVRAIFDEYQRTGRVSKHLPEEVRTVSEDRRRDRELERETQRAGRRGTSNPIRKTPSTVEASVIPMDSAKVPNAPLNTNLSLADNLVDAPSIGPKTAKRFAGIGVTTVREFLAGEAGELATRLGTRWITADKIIDWQDQARLVCDVPGLCGYKSQLLVGVDCRSAKILVAEDAASLHARIVGFCATSAGKRVLRSSAVPNQPEVAKWIRQAAQSSPLRESA